MDRSQVITLISQEKIQDENGVWRTIENARSVFCSVNSVTSNEFFEGGRNVLNPEYQSTMFRYDYNGETIIKYEGQRYGVYRTYFGRDDTIELYVERKGGTNGNAKGWV